MSISARSGVQAQLLPGALLGITAAAVALTNGLLPKVALCLALLIIPLAWWLVCEPNRWLYALFLVAWLSPPLPLKLGDSGPHLAIMFAAAGLLIGLLRASEWKFRANSLSVSIVLLVAVMFASAAMSAFYSGAAIAAGSFARVMLFGVAIYSFFYIQDGPFSKAVQGARTLVNLLFWASVASATFALVDFYFQFPAPAGYEAQFVWLDTGAFRRAQGFFYEASTLGNLCVFFLEMIAAAMLCRQNVILIKRWMLLCGALPLLAALVLSYSRASLASLLAGLLALAWLLRKQLLWRRWLAAVSTVCLGAYVLLVKLFPDFAEAYLMRLSNTFQFFWASPNAILSGRIHSWEILGSFLTSHPWLALVGIGYKSLPYTDITGAPIIADNTYLSALVEMGIPGLLIVLFFNFAVLKTSYTAAKATNPDRSFYGKWLFCFWIGQVIQMFSADLLTYWRVLPAYFCVLALASKTNNHMSIE